MIKSTNAFIKKYNLVGKKIGVGLSGGIDSVVLTYILSKIKGIEVVVLHLNHNWRGIESKEDEKFSFEFAKKLGLEFYSETLDKSLKKTETNAREYRYDFFARAKDKLGLDAIFLAHNKNDKTETLIYRLSKGTGPRGLLSIPAVRDFYYRPLIDFERSEIESFAKENNLSYRIDKSNFDTKYKRNLIRSDILPLLKKINPNVINSISSFIKVNEMNQKIVDDYVDEKIKTIKTEEKYDRKVFLKLNKEVQFEIINRILQGVVKTRDFKTVEKILNFILSHSSSKISINNDTFLKVYADRFYIVQNKKNEYLECDLKVGENNFLNYTFIIEKSPAPKVFPNNNSNIQYVNLDFDNPYKLRTKKAGDKILPFKSKTSQKLKTFLIKKKIPLEQRDKIPFIALSDEVLFIPFIMVSDKLKVGENQSECYKVTVRGSEK